MAALAPLPSVVAGASSFSGGEMLRASFLIQPFVPSSRGSPVVATLSHGEQSHLQRAVIAMNAVAITDFVRTIGYTLEVEDDEEFDDDDEEIIHVDNESIDDADQLDISRLGISDSVVDALEKRGIIQLFPIQRAVLDPALQGRDLIARAKTGTGKTLAFGIPIINNIMRELSLIDWQGCPVEHLER